MGKSEIRFVDNSKEVKRALENLAKKGLREAAKIVREELKKDSRVIKNNHLINHVGSIVKTEKYTKVPYCEVGFIKPSKVKKLGRKVSRSNPYWLENGTKPHVIAVGMSKTSKEKETTAMGWKDNYLGKSVFHPGERAQHVLRDAIQKNIGQIREIQQKTINILSQKLEDVAKQLDKTPDDKD